jgi:hypothetical protein
LYPLFDARLDEDVSVGLSYSFTHRAFMIQNLGDYVWTPDELESMGLLCDRSEIVNTDMAARVFALVDEIWLGDPYVLEFVRAANENYRQD